MAMDIRDVRAAFPTVARAVAIPVVAPVTHETDLQEIRERIEAIAIRDRDATKRVKVHLTCIASGMVIALSLTFAPAIPPVIHFGAPCLPSLGACWQEILDWIRHW